jgi:hypothetical protein
MDDPLADLPTIELTKIDVAEAHIRTAVRLFFEGCHPVPVYTLANAAREILTSIGKNWNRGCHIQLGPTEGRHP